MLSRKKQKSMDLFPVYTGSGWVDCLCELCFGFVTKTAGNTLVFWLLLSITGTVLRLPRSPWCVGWGGQEAGRGFGLGQLLPVDCKDILCCITSCSAKNPEGTDGLAGRCLLLGTAGHQSACGSW